jgi:hypothetical protein
VQRLLGDGRGSGVKAEANIHPNLSYVWILMRRNVVLRYRSQHFVNSNYNSYKCTYVCTTIAPVYVQL